MEKIKHIDDLRLVNPDYLANYNSYQYRDIYFPISGEYCILLGRIVGLHWVQSENRYHFDLSDGSSINEVYIKSRNIQLYANKELT